jgi:tellurium resistance protein TerZ
LLNAQNNQEVARFNLSCQGSHTALIVAKLYRHNGEWKMHAIGENAVGRTFNDLMPQMVAML